MHECRKCEQFGLRFERHYRPDDYIVGSAQSPIWIVGLNPADEPRPGLTALREYFDDPSGVHSYFRRFAVVSPRLFNSFGKPFGTAHTDLVKCVSHKWPPPGVRPADRSAIIRNCEGFLVSQIKKYRPVMIICNGSEVSDALKRALPPSSKPADCPTSYFTQVDGQKLCIVLSGFIGRLDTYAKQRLGAEIEARLAELGM